MKNILCAALILCGCIGVFAQEKTISEAEFKAVYKNSEEAWKDKSHRRTITTESKAEGRPQTDYSSKSVVESASPTVNRVTYETSFGSKVSKRELIKIGDKSYARKEGEAWREGDSKNEPPAVKTISGSVNPADVQTEYKYFGNETLNGQNAKVYAVIVKTKNVDPAGKQEILSVSTTKYWFADDGMILKSDMTMESRNGGKLSHSRATQIWEADSNIKIESPKLN